MAKLKSRGSIILEILIVILIVALIATILYPKKVWRDADLNAAACRKNMDKILKAELVYLKYHNTYEDTLDKVISFIESDTTGTLILEYIYSDTALAIQIKDKLTQQDSMADLKIKSFLADTTLFVVLATTKYDSNLATVILKRLESTPLANSIKAARNTDSSNVWILAELSKEILPLDIMSPLEQDDSLKLVLARIKPEITVGALIDTLHKNPLWAAQIDSEVKKNFQAIQFCPTYQAPYKLSVIDTSVIKYLNINCPIDSIDIENTKRDFKLYHLGHLRLENHGSIDGGEKSWLKQ